MISKLNSNLSKFGFDDVSILLMFINENVTQPDI